MKINVKATNTELTPAIHDYVVKQATHLEKLLAVIENQGGEVVIDFEVGKSTKHHKSGEVFHADCLVKFNGEKFYASADEEDLYKAIDKIRDVLFRDIRRSKERKQTLFHRGARSVKKMLKGLSSRNPFTGKY